MRNQRRLPVVSGAIAKVELTKGRTAVISACDAIAVGYALWHVQVSPGGTYANGRVGGETIGLHVFIGRLMGFDGSLLVDHVNGDGLDCRRENLRQATRGQNATNAKLARNNTSGFRGVCRYKRRWQAAIKLHGKTVVLGRFKSIEEAAAVVSAKRKELYGDFEITHDERVARLA